MSLKEKEKLKYNFLHSQSGFDKNQQGYGRQLELLLTSDLIFFKKIRENLNQEGKLLEIGVGAGEMTTWFLENEIDFKSVDISSYAVESLQKLLNTDRVIECSADSLTFEDGSFKTVLHLDGMEHIPREIEVECLRQAARVSNGFIFYANACTDAYWDHVLKANGHDEAHINIKTPTEWEEFYSKYENEFNYKLISKEVVGDTVYFIIEKK